jgi:hypothetical protein
VGARPHFGRPVYHDLEASKGSAFSRFRQRQSRLLRSNKRVGCFGSTMLQRVRMPQPDEVYCRCLLRGEAVHEETADRCFTSE